MEIIRDELERLRTDRETAQTQLAESQRDLDEVRTKCQQLNEQFGPLQQLVSELDAAREGLAKECAATKREVKDAGKLYSDLLPVLSKKVSSKEREAFEWARNAVHETEGQIASLKNQSTTDLEARGAALQRAGAADASVRQRMDDLRTMTTRMQTARQAIARLIRSTTDASSAGRIGEAFVTLCDLKAQSDLLATAANEKDETEQVKEIVEEWETGKVARKEAAEKAASLAALRNDLAAVEKELAERRKTLSKARAALAKETSSATNGKAALSGPLGKGTTAGNVRSVES